MKYIYVSLFYMCCFTATASAQTPFGLLGGVNASWMGIDNEKMNIGFHAGAYGRFNLNETFYLQPELVYSIKGTDLDDYLLYDLSLSFTYSYLSLPVLFGVNLGDAASIYIGPELSYLLGVKTFFEPNYYSNEREGTPTTDIGIAVGFHIQIKDRIGLQVRYVHGFTEMIDIYFTDINGLSIGNVTDGTNRVLQAGVTYRLSRDSDSKE